MISLGLLSVIIAEGIVHLSSTMLRSPLKGLENQIVDLSFQTRLKNTSHNQVTTDDIVIIDIDDESIERLGRPQLWPRAFDAFVINYVGSGLPKAIGVDFLYTEPDTLSSVYVDILEARGFYDTQDMLQAMSTDPELSMAVESAANVYLAMFDDDQKEPKVISSQASKFLNLIDVENDESISFDSLNFPVLPIRNFAAFAKGIGTINMNTEQDGTVRNYYLLKVLNDSLPQKSLIANFPLYMALDALGVKLDEVLIEDGNLIMGNKGTIPLDENAAFRINWLGNQDEIRYIPYHKVLSGRTPVEFFENKFVFLGTSASGMQDLKTVPSTTMLIPGAEVHAIAFLNIINQAFIKEVSEIEALPWFILLSFFLVSVFLLMRPFLGFVFAVAAVFGEMFFFIIWFLPAKQTVFPIVTFMLITIFAYLISTLYIHFIRERSTRRLKIAFSSYLSPDVVNKIAKESSMLNMGGEKKELSVLFSDIRNFTSYSEKLDPQAIVAVLNDYLSDMSECIFRQKGTIDKFIGDAIMAIFGAPIAQADHADRACRVALDMIRVLEEFNKQHSLREHSPFAIGIGVNTGSMTVGNIGSQKRFDYTVIGDEVNLGARLEGMTKYFKVNIIISESTLKACKNPVFIVRQMAIVLVKGKDNPVKIYELMGMIDEIDFDFAHLELWKKSINYFDNSDLQSAKIGFEEYLNIYPHDVPSSLYIDRCKHGLVSPELFSPVLQMDNK